LHFFGFVGGGGGGGGAVIVSGRVTVVVFPSVSAWVTVAVCVPAATATAAATSAAAAASDKLELFRHGEIEQRLCRPESLGYPQVERRQDRKRRVQQQRRLEGPPSRGPQGGRVPRIG
jgi:hypothetical protein